MEKARTESRKREKEKKREGKVSDRSKLCLTKFEGSVLVLISLPLFMANH